MTTRGHLLAALGVMGVCMTSGGEFAAAAQTGGQAACDDYRNRQAQSDKKRQLKKFGRALGNLAGSALERETGVYGMRRFGNEVGDILGDSLASELNPCEQTQAADATKRALDAEGDGDATQQDWKSDTNADVSGTATVTSTRVAADGSTCKTVRQTGYVGGREIIDEVELCQRADGSWA
ncbi:MAG TPA: hypothetical protein PKM48_04260 [Parvularculaceae bacterium]|nr:hypothetical protein [Parvularculaceae bacterium]HNS87623.1 hypothetical protein [Parvularculaceae bacterium]